MKALLLVILSLTAVLAGKMCNDDSDCPDGCCAHSFAGNFCKPMGKLGDVCDLEGYHLADGVCSCEPGFQCQKIDLGEIDPVAASANPILEKYHYGMCVEKIVIG